MATTKKTAGKTAKDETKVLVTCPKCGEQIEVEIPNNEHFAAGMAIGKDSGLGTIFLPTVSPAQKKRMDELQKSGVVFESTIKVKTADGKTIELKQTADGNIDLSDPVIKSIINGGNLYDPRIAKQHVTAMMLKMLTREWYCCGRATKKKNGQYDLSHFQKNMLRAGYEYTWKVLADKLNEQAHMAKNRDNKAFIEDNRWYNKALALRMFDDYMEQLKYIFENARVHRNKNRKYIKFHYVTGLGCSYQGVYISDFNRIYDELEQHRYCIANANNPTELSERVAELVKVMPRLRLAPSEYKRGEEPLVAKQCPEWQDAYKGYGAFFTMKNLILYHDCRVYMFHNGKCKVLDESQSIEQINEWAQNQHGYWLMGALKQFLEYNNFDIAAKQAEWRAAKSKK